MMLVLMVVCVVYSNAATVAAVSVVRLLEVVLRRLISSQTAV